MGQGLGIGNLRVLNQAYAAGLGFMICVKVKFLVRLRVWGQGSWLGLGFGVTVHDLYQGFWLGLGFGVRVHDLCQGFWLGLGSGIGVIGF